MARHRARRRARRRARPETDRWPYRPDVYFPFSFSIQHSELGTQHSTRTIPPSPPPSAPPSPPPVRPHPPPHRRQPPPRPPAPSAPAPLSTPVACGFVFLSAYARLSTRAVARCRPALSPFPMPPQSHFPRPAPLSAPTPALPYARDRQSIRSPPASEGVRRDSNRKRGTRKSRDSRARAPSLGATADRQRGQLSRYKVPL